MSGFRNICIYCGSSNRVAESYQTCATQTGIWLAESNRRLIYGGGRTGLMGLAADAVLSRGGEVFGIIPSFLKDKELAHEDITRLETVQTMHERKQRMAELADAFLVLPGGFGTLDEAMEILTWKQIGLHDSPVLFLNAEGFWDSVLDAFNALVREGFARAEDLSLFQVVPTVGHLEKALAQTQPARNEVLSKWI